MIVVCGEALIDLTAVEVAGEQLWRALPGGGPHNAAIALARLGVPVRFIGRLSTDRFGQQLAGGLAADGVDLTWAVTGPEPTTLAVVALDEGGSPTFSFYGEGTADRLLGPGDLPADLGDAEAVHFGTLSLVNEPQASTLEALMRRESGRRLLFCDPNVRPLLIGALEPYLAKLQRWLELVDVVKFSDADLAWLAPGEDPAVVSARWADRHGVVVVLTRGAHGADAFWPGGHVFRPATPVDVVDTVGAGDTFGAAFLAELRRRRPLVAGLAAALGDGAGGAAAADIAAALDHAGRAAAITCSRAGADPPRADEL
ncbi:MAG: carbohydrate kinase [Acidimicrobiia bacterium]